MNHLQAALLFLARVHRVITPVRAFIPGPFKTSLAFYYSLYEFRMYAERNIQKSDQMTTQLFIEPELEKLHENSGEWEQLCAGLGLQKQLKKAGKVEKVGNPYMKLDPRTERVYEILCPRRELYTAYEASTLPLEVLQEIHRCKENEWFPKIEVWHDDKSPDPFLIGYDSKKWGNKFLIARWGDELLPFEQLVHKAINRYKEAYMRALNRLIMDCETRKQDIEGEIRAYIDLGDWRWDGFGFPCFENPIK